MARKAKSRRPGGGRVGVTPPQNKSSNGSTNGFHKTEAQPPLLGKDHPLAGAMGAFKDDPFWDEFIQLMKEARREEDERYFKELEVRDECLHSALFNPDAHFHRAAS